MTRTVYLGVLAVACGAAGTYVYASAAKERETTPAARKQYDDLRADVKGLERRLANRETLASLSRLSANDAEDVQKEPTDDQQLPADPPLEAPPSLEASKVKEQESAARIASRFESETIDSAWRSEATPLLARQFGARTPSGSRLTSIECRSSMCRVEAVHDSFDAYSEFTRAAITAPDAEWQGSFVAHVVGDPYAGQVRSRAYMVRPGEDLAALITEEQE